MGRPRKRQRRRFGRLRTITKHGHEYIEASYLTPLWAFSQWPNLPKRQYKVVQPEYETEAVAWLTEAEKAITLGAWTPPQLERARERREAVTFRDYAEQWVRNRRKANGDPIRETSKQKHREALRLYLYPAFGDKRLTDITAKDVQAWWDAFTPERANEEGVSLEARRRAVYATLRAIMASAAREPVDDDGNTLIKATPCTIRTSQGETRHKVVIAEIDQLQALYEAMPAWIRLTAYLAGYMGLREGECLGLQRQDIDLDTMTLHVRRAAKTEEYEDGTKKNVLGPPKSRSSVRDLTIPECVVQPLREHMEHVGNEPDALLFPAPRSGGVCAGQTLRNAFNRVVNDTPALAGMRFHDLRDTALTRLAAMGATNGELMRQAGHQTIAVASKYQHRVESHYDTVISNLDNAVTAASATNDKTTPEPAQDGDMSTQTIPDARPNDRQPDADNELAALAGVLAAMPLSERVTVLRSLPIDRRVAVVGALPATVKGETLAELFKT
ncbi:integrase [Bifidobacterium margollesii]|uniref:Integrase n=1 Tax=Bifidobacterium margollesii TaxID=2020964 RepID=A0A2N5JD08_9BIFI|nr:site-specific integrase [Bifidobacterium margollesii]PLS32102.1 integrase [Bifidobacterium margollesii]